MLTQTPVYIVAAGEDLSPATALSMPCLHLAYTLGSQGQLHREGPESRSSGGLLGFYDNGLTSAPFPGPAGRLMRDRSGKNVPAAGFPAWFWMPRARPPEELVSALSPLLDQWSFPYYVPIKLASLAPSACLSSALHPL